MIVTTANKNIKSGSMHHLYAVTADYRPYNPHSPIYYIYAESPREAKQKFQNRISWLKAYEVTELDEAEANKIIAEGKYKHIIIE